MKYYEMSSSLLRFLILLLCLLYTQSKTCTDCWLNISYILAAHVSSFLYFWNLSAVIFYNALLYTARQISQNLWRFRRSKIRHFGQHYSIFKIESEGSITRPDEIKSVSVISLVLLSPNLWRTSSKILPYAICIHLIKYYLALLCHLNYKH